MHVSTLPAEIERIATLHAMNILDTPPEERFDRITRLAQRMFDVPIVLISLIDTDRQWFKSCIGLAIDETPRSVSFCTHAVDDAVSLVVRDTTTDPRFQHNPLVTGEPHIRFYAGVPLSAPNGHLLGTLCLIDRVPRELSDADLAGLQDLTALVENELSVTAMSQVFVRQIDELERANRHKDEFLSVISHELRTPLNFITGFASILEDEVQGPLSPEQHATVGKILMGADRMLRLVGDLLDVARIQAGQLLLEPMPCDVRGLVEEVIASFAPLAEPKGIALVSDVEGPPLMQLDGARITQVLTNLVGNAVKFMEQGEVCVRARWRDDRLVVEVTDTGPGIAPADQVRLFGRFQQLDMSVTRRTAGTGLGLAISRAIVEAHGGRIGVHSELGQGATFWFSLPVTGSGTRPAGEATQVVPPMPENEAERLGALRSLNLLDTPQDPRYDRLTRLVAEFFRVPIAIVSLIDADRQWFKSCFGLDGSGTSRAVSFCAHAINAEETMVVPDARLDARFMNNPSVLGPPFIRFYAGRPLRGPRGHLIGTLCLCDSQPRNLSLDERRALDDFARLVEAEILADPRNCE